MVAVKRVYQGIILVMATVLLCGLLLFATYNRGVQRGMPGVLEWGPGPMVYSMTLALSDRVYGFHLGYVGSPRIFQRLWDVWTGGDGEATVVPRLHDTELINQGIKEASELNAVSPGPLNRHGLMTGYYNDLGTVDYIKLSFMMFGPNIQSLYKFFFVVLGVSVVAFLWAFPGNSAGRCHARSGALRILCRDEQHDLQRLHADRIRLTLSGGARHHSHPAPRIVVDMA